MRWRVRSTASASSCRPSSPIASASRGDFPLRVQAGVLHVLRESAERGHCFLPLADAGKARV